VVYILKPYIIIEQGSLFNFDLGINPLLYSQSRGFFCVLRIFFNKFEFFIKLLIFLNNFDI
jgi:hypothetical protein